MFYGSYNAKNRLPVGATRPRKSGTGEKPTHITGPGVIRFEDDTLIQFFLMNSNKYRLIERIEERLGKNENGETIVVKGEERDLFEANPNWPPVGYREDPENPGRLVPEEKEEKETIVGKLVTKFRG